jgi:hypothetical protein
MKIVPELTATRFEQLNPGDLFIFLENGRSCVALATQNPEEVGGKLILLLGPQLPEEMNGPHLIGWGGVTVVSFGSEYELRLPTTPNLWSDVEPPAGHFCVLLADDVPFFRANCSPIASQYRTCYVRVQDGAVSFRRPPGIHAFALSYEVLAPKMDRGLAVILKIGT